MDSRGSRGPQEGAVLMVYGLNMDKMNADRLFNLLCLYGNVFKVIRKGSFLHVHISLRFVI